MSAISDEGEPGSGDVKRVSAEISPHLTTAEYNEMGDRLIRQWLSGPRSLEGGNFMPLGIADMEVRMGNIEAQIGVLPSPNDDPYRNAEIIKGHTKLNEALGQSRSVLGRQRNRIALYLSSVETQMHFGQVNGDIFERNRVYVEERLRSLAPEVLDQFATAYKRHAEGGPEARAHALLSCRRVLKTLADALYPATNESVEGIDGRTRIMDADSYINRLCQFAAEAAHGSSSRDLLVSNVKALGEQLRHLNSLDSKGVHADASSAEADQCLIQTFTVVGDLLRIADHASTTVGAEAA